MKYRSGSSKIKQEHGMIGGLRKFLQEHIEPLAEVRSIIPGRISRVRGGGVRSELEVRFQYTTETGAKLLARGPGVVQEVFVVTDDAEGLRERLSGP